MVMGQLDYLNDGSWIVHRCGDLIGPGIRVTRVLYQAASSFQDIQVVESTEYGRVLLLDDDPQLGSFCETHYHEPLVWPAMLTAEKAHRIFIAGGGDGGAAREALKFDGVREIVLAEIDELVIEACRQHLRIDEGALSDSRVKVSVGDAVDLLAGSNGSFDCIISDLTSADTSKMASTGFSDRFFELASSKLTSGGVFSTQAHSTHPKHFSIFHSLARSLRRHFRNVRLYQAFVPIFCTTWGFALCANDDELNSRISELPARDLMAGARSRVHSGESLLAAFSLPAYLKEENL
jgi:spermidine synthase